MEIIEAITLHPPAGGMLKRAGVDIMENVNSRMVPPQERATLVKGGPASDQVEQLIASRLRASLRDEAIWQYHIGGRGLGFWCANQSLRYIRAAELNRRTFRPQTAGGIPALLDTYDPAKEALVLVEYPDSIESHRIEEDAKLTLLWQAPLLLRTMTADQDENAS